MELINEIIKKKSAICAGIEPKLEKMPKEIVVSSLSLEDKIFVFLKEVLDGINTEVAAVNLSFAFFEKYGIEGVKAYKKVVEYCDKIGLFAICDVKKTGIGSEAKYYAEAYLKKKQYYDCDAITVIPYLDTDSCKEFYDVAVLNNKIIFQVIKTLNSGINEIQDLVFKGDKLYQIQAKKILEDSKYLKKYESIGIDIGTYNLDDIKYLRNLLNERIFLIRGYGSEHFKETIIKEAFNADGLGALINITNEIIYAYHSLGKGVKESAYIVAKNKKEEINKIRKAKI